MAGQPWLKYAPTEEEEEILAPPAVERGKPWLKYAPDVSPTPAPAPEAPAPQEGGMMGQLGRDAGALWEGAKEAVTGEKRTTPEIEALPEFGDTAAANAFTLPAFKSAIGMLSSFSPKDQIGIIKQNFPEAEFKTDKNGVTKVTIAGEESILNKPGFSPQDVTTGIAQMLAFVPVARLTSFGTNLAAKIGIGATGSAATQAGLETAQTVMGGDFDKTDIAMAGLFGGGAELIGPLVKNTYQLGKDATLRTTEAGKKAYDKLKKIGMQRAEDLQQAVELEDLGIDPNAWKLYNKDEKIRVLEESREAAKYGMSRSDFASMPPDQKASMIAEGERMAQQKSDREMVNKFVEATRMGEKRGKESEAAQMMSEMAEADPKIQEAANRLNMSGKLTAAQMTKNPIFRDVAMAVESSPGSQLSSQTAENILSLMEAGKDLITRLGGELDQGAVSSGLENSMMRTVKALEEEADKLYKNVEYRIKPGTPIKANALMEYLETRIKNEGFDFLDSEEKALYKAFQPSSNPTYGRLDSFRKKVGEGYKGKNEIFKDAGRAKLDTYYGLLTEAQESAALKSNVLPLFRAAKESVKGRKQLEDDMRGLFGQKLDKTLSRTIGPAVKNLKVGNWKEFEKIVQKIPAQERGQVVASSLSNVVNVRLNEYMKWYKGISDNPSSKNILFKHLPKEFKQGLEDLHTVGQGIQKASRKAIATGRIQDINEAFEAADQISGGIYREAIKTGVASKLGGYAGIATNELIDKALDRNITPVRKAADDLLMSSRFQMFLNKAATNEKEEILNKAAKSVEESAAWKKYVKHLSKASRDYIKSFGFVDWVLRRPAIMRENALTPEELTSVSSQLARQQVGDE